MPDTKNAIHRFRIWVIWPYRYNGREESTSDAQFPKDAQGNMSAPWPGLGNQFTPQTALGLQQRGGTGIRPIYCCQLLLHHAVGQKGECQGIRRVDAHL